MIDTNCYCGASNPHDEDCPAGGLALTGAELVAEHTGRPITVDGFPYTTTAPERILPQCEATLPAAASGMDPWQCDFPKGHTGHHYAAGLWFA